MKRAVFLVLAVAIAVLIGLSASARAQVPPHYPGAVCFTPNFWCWLSPPQPPNSACYCSSPYGNVQGVAG